MHMTVADFVGRYTDGNTEAGVFDSLNTVCEYEFSKGS